MPKEWVSQDVQQHPTLKSYTLFLLNLLHFLFVLKGIIVLHSSRIMRNDILDLAYIKLTNVHISMK